MLPSDFRHLAARGRASEPAPEERTAVGTPNYRRLRSTLQLVPILLYRAVQAVPYYYGTLISITCTGST